MKLCKVLFVYSLLLFVLPKYAQAQYNVVLGSKVESFEVKKVSNGSTKTPSSNTTYNLEELEEAAISDFHLTSDGTCPTYSDIFEVAKTPKSNFLFLPTRTQFPYQIERYQRNQIILSNTDEGKVSAIYKPTGDSKSHSGFYIQFLPGGFGTEGRLRETFMKELNHFSKDIETNKKPEIKRLRYNARSYNSLGLQALFRMKNGCNSSLTIYECGSWLLEIKVTKLEADSLAFQQFHNQLVQIFKPSRLTAVKPLYKKANLDFNSEGLKDPSMTGALWAAAMAKINWASTQINQRERAAGFPDLYLEMHLFSIKEYLKVQSKKSDLKSSSKARQFYHDLLAINNAGFLPEYIMEQYQYLMIVPSNIKFDFEAYRQWKTGKNIQTNINKKLYKISYRNLPY